MKGSIQYRYEDIKKKLDEKWASPRGPEKFQKLEEKCRVYREQTGERFYAYHAVILVYDIGPDGRKHSYRNAAKIINGKFIADPRKWITDTMVHDQKYVGLYLLGIDIEYNVGVRRKGEKVEDAWRKYQKVQELKAELPEKVAVIETESEKEWEGKIIRDAEIHLQWLEAEKRQVLPIVIKLQQDLADWQAYLKKILRLLEIEHEQLKLLRKLEQDWECRYWRNIIKALD